MVGGGYHCCQCCTAVDSADWLAQRTASKIWTTVGLTGLLLVITSIGLFVNSAPFVRAPLGFSNFSTSGKDYGTRWHWACDKAELVKAIERDYPQMTLLNHREPLCDDMVVEMSSGGTVALYYVILPGGPSSYGYPYYLEPVN